MTHWRGVALFTVAAFLLLVILGAFIALAEYAPTYRVMSYTDSLNGLVRLKAPASGRVTRIAVKDGDSVRSGDLLAVLGRDRYRTDGSSENTAMRQRLDAERDMIDREMTAARNESNASRQMIDRRLAGLRAERDMWRSDIRSAEQLLSSLKAQSDRHQSLAAKGYMAESQAAQKRDEMFAQESRLANGRGSLAKIEREIAVSESEYRSIDARLNAQLENLRRERGERDRLMLQSDAEAEQVIRAPQDGTVSLAAIANGQSVVPGQLLFTVAPAGEPLVVKLLLPGRAAVHVKSGQDVQLAFHAYPQERFGQFVARVDSVSDNPLLPADVPQPGTVSEPVYMAVASLPTGLRSPSGEVLRLKPGMQADALVPVERRTILEWLIDPILRSINGSAARVHTVAPDNSQ